MSGLFLLSLFLSVATLANGQDEVDTCVDEQFDKHCEYQDRKVWPYCCVYGDPHFQTFDEAKFRFGEQDDFCLVDSCENGTLENNLRITAVIEPRKVNDEQFRIKAIIIFWGTYVYDIWHDTIYCANLADSSGSWQEVTLSYINETTDVIMFKVTDGSTVIWLGNLVRISYREKFHKLYIWINEKEFDPNTVCGLCGIFNGDPVDDTNCSINYKQEDGKTQGEAGCTIPALGDQWRAPDLPANLQVAPSP